MLDYFAIKEGSHSPLTENCMFSSNLLIIISTEHIVIQYVTRHIEL
jgi:hypothetical protein